MLALIIQLTRLPHFGIIPITIMILYTGLLWVRWESHRVSYSRAARIAFFHIVTIGVAIGWLLGYYGEQLHNESLQLVSMPIIFSSIMLYVVIVAFGKRTAIATEQTPPSVQQ